MKNKSAILFALLAMLAATLACGTTAPAGVSNIRMASDKDGTNLTTTFTPSDEIFVIFDINQVETGAAFQIRWYALDIEGQDPETPFTTSDYTYNDEDSIYAQVYSTEGSFPSGQYKVEIYLNDARVGEQQFSIQ